MDDNAVRQYGITTANAQIMMRYFAEKIAAELTEELRARADLTPNLRVAYNLTASAE